MKGKFITFEGAEGSGKSTQATLIYKYLQEKKQPVIFLREPGGVKISEAIRRILLNVKNSAMTGECELLLYMAARAQLVGEKIQPALEAGKVVLCDRYLDSSVAYQGFGNGVDRKLINIVGRFATRAVRPDLTLLFDIDTAEGLARTGEVKDRIESRSLEYHQLVREGYLKLAQEDPRRIKVIKVDRVKEGIFEIARKHVDKLLGY